MNPYTDFQIKSQFQSGKQDVESLIAPLIELSQESSTLILGYGMAQAGIRDAMIPYFHVCGTGATEQPIRALIVGGWFGTESVTPLAIARLLSAMESTLQLLEGIEVTAYPVSNLEAHREGVFLTADQQAKGVRCWEESPFSHIQVLEKELRRYEYDVVFLLREHPRAMESDVEAWLSTDEQKTVMGDALKRYALAAPKFRWKANPIRPTYKRAFTPMPDVERQPAEIIIGLPGALTPEEQSSDALGLVLSLLHAARQGRLEGLL